MSIPDRRVYPTQPRPLIQQIEERLKHAAPATIDGEVLSLVVPSTNRVSGGGAAAEAYALLKGRSYDTVILVAPSHEGTFGRINICSVDSYHSPLGDVPVNDKLRHELCDEDDDIFLSDRGHFHTEGIDVQLPFLQTVLDDFDVVPIVMGEESPDFCRELGHAVGEIMYNRRTLVVAAADVVDATDTSLDQFIEHFEGQDVSRLMALLNSEQVRMEGKGPALVALIAAMHRRGEHARVLRTELPQEGQPGHVSAVVWRS
jgi:hypothetical protein